MYEVGQIVYIFKESNESLFPCVVAEELIKKTLDGEETHYTVLLPDKEGTLVELEKLSVLCFQDLHEFKDFYLDRINNRISESIKNCKKVEDERFSRYKTVIINNGDEKTNSKKEDKVIIEDENNVKLNIDISKLKEIGL